MEANPTDMMSPGINYDEFNNKMETGVMSRAILDRHSSGHSLTTPTWVTIPVLYHAAADDILTAIETLSRGQDSLWVMSYNERNPRCRLRPGDGEAIKRSIYEFTGKAGRDRIDMLYAKKYADFGLLAMQNLEYSKAVSSFDVALKILSTCRRDTLFELWIKVHRGHALLRAGLLECPAVHDQRTGDLLEASMETFCHCEAKLRKQSSPTQPSPTHLVASAFRRNLLFSNLLGLAWVSLFRGDIGAAEEYIYSASSVQISYEDLRGFDRNLDIIFLQVALHRATGDLQALEECIDRFGYKVSDFCADIGLVGLLDLECEFLRGDDVVLWAMRGALSSDHKVSCGGIGTVFVKIYLDQLEAGYGGNVWFAVGALEQARVAYETAYASNSLLLQAAALVGLGNVLVRDAIANVEPSLYANADLDNSRDIQANQTTLRFTEAEEKYKKALEIYDELRYNEAQIIVHCNLGTLYHKQEQLDRALKQYQKAMTYVRGKMNTSISAINLRLKIAELHLDKENLVEAFKFIQEAEEFSSTLNRSGESLIQHLYGTFYLRKASKQKGWADQSLVLFTYLGRLVTKWNDKQSNDLFRATAHLFNAVNCSAEIQLKLVQTRLTPFALTLYEQQKETYALLLWCLACQRDNSTSPIEALVWSEKSRSRTSMAERWEVFANPLREYLSEEIFEAIRALALEGFDQLDWQKSWKNMQLLLSECTLSTGTVLVEYVLCADFGYLIFVLDLPGGQPKMKRVSFKGQKLNGEKLDRRSLTALVKRTNRLLSHSDESHKNGEVESNLSSLYKLLIEPVEKWLTKSEHIVLIPHEVLFKVPFHALINGKRQYLIERCTISCAESIRSFVQCWFRWHLRQQQQNDHSSTAHKTRKWLVVGINKHEPIARDLKFAEDEATEIASLELDSGVAVHRIIGSQATKEQVNPYLADADVIHLATHGIINPKYEMGGILFVAPAHLEIGERATSIVSVESAYATTETDETTMRSMDDYSRSVKWLIENQSAAEKLVLNGSELSKMDLNARLVVLSACQSADGVVLGEGVAGLGRALLMAGVPCTVLSLWPVSDKATIDFMKIFYTELAKGLSVANAMRTAMVSMLRKRFSNKSKYTVRHWAAFMSFGLPFVQIQDQRMQREFPHAPSSSRSQLTYKFPFHMDALVGMAIAAMVLMLAIYFYN